MILIEMWPMRDDPTWRLCTCWEPTAICSSSITTTTTRLVAMNLPRPFEVHSVPDNQNSLRGPEQPRLFGNVVVLPGRTYLLYTHAGGGRRRQGARRAPLTALTRKTGYS